MKQLLDEFLDVGMKEKRSSVVAEMKRLQADTEVITKIFEDEDISKSIQSTRSVLFHFYVLCNFMCIFDLMCYWRYSLAVMFRISFNSNVNFS